MFFLRQLIYFCCYLSISSYSLAQAIEDKKPSKTTTTEASSTVSLDGYYCPLPIFAQIASNEPPITDDSIKIQSKYSSIEKDQIAHFTGDVVLIDKNQKITANELSFNSLSMNMNAKGNIQYQSENINIFASELTASKLSKSSTMTDASYQLKDNPGHGSATTLFIDADGLLILQDSTFTTCTGESPDWQLKAGEITLSDEGDFGEAYHAQFRVFDVPIFYTPYFSFPLSKKRKTGFLIPKFGNSTRVGLDIEAPFYWNISENMDATITPRYMSKRGLQLINEFRYLSGLQSGQVNIEYLNNDKALNSDSSRYLARFQHVGTISDNFRLYVDYTTISDDNYLADLGSEQYNSNDAYLYQVTELSYFSENWQAKIQLQDFEVLGDNQQGYRTLPQIEVKSIQPLPFTQGQLELYSEFSHFQTSDDLQAKTNRFHVEAGLLFPISTPAWFFNTELKILQTYYQQDNLLADSELDEKVSRTLPKIRFHGGINFDRSLSLFTHNYRQTFEPQLQYLYIKDTDQSNIGLYDTTRLQDDYNGLFRDRRYSGLDRIAAANQYTLGVTSRLLDESNIEVFRISLGRITYFDGTNPDDFTDGSNITSRQSSLAADLFFKFNHQWQISGDLQYNTQESYANKSQINIDYRFDSKHIIQLNHRYTRDVSDTRLQQVSLLASLALNKDWAFVGRVTQDIEQKRSLETYAGMQYESCCWAIRFAFHRNINSNFEDNSLTNENRDEFDSGFVIQFIFKGLNGKQNAIGTEDMFNSSIFGYKRPYFLNN